ncbi:MAG TPA: hypothetical protein VMA36_15285 [Candidatus Limnocylindria bacterium]|nr:hypothetical protein [Candidatus Limnocylindria bacterium]
MARLLFCLATALTAAAIADPLVERLSNAGIFGAGRFTDRSNADVVPALCLGALFAALFVLALARRLLARTSTTRWLRVSDAALSSSVVTRLLPATFAVQIATLFGMETLEQTLVFGRDFGGTVWLGGPLLVSLAIHALACVAVAALLAGLLHRLARHVAEVIAFVRQLILAWAALTPAPPARVLLIPPRRSQEPALARLQGRAPPFPRL